MNSIQKKGRENPFKKNPATAPRISAEQRRMMQAVAALFKGGMHRSMLNRLHLILLRAGTLLPMNALAVASHQHGNARVPHYEKIEREYGLEIVLTTYLQALSRGKIKGFASKVRFDYAELCEAARAYQESLGTKVRVLFMDCAPMICDALHLTEAQNFVLPKSGSFPTRLTMKTGDNAMRHGCLLTRPTPGTVTTMEESMAAAHRHARKGDVPGLFVCHPDESAVVASTSPAPELKDSAKPVNLTQAAALFIVNQARLFKKGLEVVVTLADSTGAIDPVQLKHEILRHNIKTRVSFIYLPTKDVLRA